MTTNKQCSRWDDKARRCMSGHIRTSSLCWGVVSGPAPQCLLEDPPAQLITESGLPLAAHIREVRHDNQ